MRGISSFRAELAEAPRALAEGICLVLLGGGFIFLMAFL